MANQIHRCGQCDETWPATPEFNECPGCGTPCAVVKAGDHTPDLEDARSRAKRAKFDRYLREESEEDRAKRQAKSPFNDDFNAVIEGAGFQTWERESIQSAEQALACEEEPSEKAA